ncbi:VWA domain-containing protein [Chloroflexota bacterium]
MEELAKSIASLEFATPVYFWIGGAVVLLLIFFPWTRKRRGLTIDLQYWKQEVAFKSKRVWALSIPIVIVSILTAGVLSDPQVTTRPITYVYGYPVMIVMDISGSMGVMEGPHRTSFTEAYEAYNDLISRRSDINFGLMMFSTENYIARYFINKDELFKDTLENEEEISELSMTTRIGDALIKASAFLTDNFKDEDKAIVLISDLDVETKGWPSLVVEMTAISSSDINIYIIATRKGIEKEADISHLPGLKIVDFKDEYGIDQIYEEIYAMQISPIREEEGLLKKSFISFLILPALGIIGLCLVLGETRFRKIP